MKITLKDARGLGKTVIQPSGLAEVLITETYNGVELKTNDGESLLVAMRDGGFEVHYKGDFGTHGFDAGGVTFRGGNITPNGKPFEKDPSLEELENRVTLVSPEA